MTTYSYDARGLLIETVITTPGNGGGGGEDPDPCVGLVPTIEGTDGDDVIQGTWQNDIIFGYGGDDTISGLSGEDIICGGPGDDTINGDAKADQLHGGPGDDIINGQSGNDTITGGAGDDTIDGGSNDDTINGGSGDDDINGGAGNDTLDGGNGTDNLNGLWNTDSCDDAETVQSCETVTNNGETDQGGTAGSPWLCNGLVATIVGTNGDDTITGTWQNDVIVALGGNDTITGASGDDTICGGPGDDVINGDSGDDTIAGEDGNDQITGASGTDLIDGGAGDDTLTGDSQDDQIQGGDGDDDINGGPGNDTLDGGNDDDFVNGLWGDDQCSGETLQDCEHGDASVPPQVGASSPAADEPAVSLTEEVVFDGSARLASIARGSVTVAQQLWDATGPLPQLVVERVQGLDVYVVPGYVRELDSSGSSRPLDVLGNLVEATEEPSPFGAGGSAGFRDEVGLISTTHLRARQYVSSLGTFISPDPLPGVSGSSSLANPYAYALNDPVNRSDPSGARSQDGSIGLEAPSLRHHLILDVYSADFGTGQMRLNETDLGTPEGDLFLNVAADDCRGFIPGLSSCDFVSTIAAEFLRLGAPAESVQYFIDNLAEFGDVSGATFVSRWNPTVGELHFNTGMSIVYGSAGAAAGYPRFGSRPRLASLPVPVGVRLPAFQRAGGIVRRTTRSLGLGDDVVVQGSRASGRASVNSDLDIAIRVDRSTFDEFLESRFRSVNPGSARERTMQEALLKGRVHAGESGLRDLRRELEATFGLKVDVSVVLRNGPFDDSLFIPFP